MTDFAKAFGEAAAAAAGGDLPPASEAAAGSEGPGADAPAAAAGLIALPFRVVKTDYLIARLFRPQVGAARASHLSHV